MPTVIKRSGKAQPFDPEKAKRSLAVTSDEIKRPLGEGDLKEIIHELCAMLEGKETVTSAQINTMLVGIMYIRGFHDVVKRYTEYAGNTWQR